MGKFGVLVARESSAGSDVLEPLGKQLAMPVAAANPLALNGDDLHADLVAPEREIADEKARMSGTPAEHMTNMLHGGNATLLKENDTLKKIYGHDVKTPLQSHIDTHDQENAE